MSTNNDIKIKSMYELNELTAEQKQDIEMIKKVESYLKKVALREHPMQVLKIDLDSMEERM